MRRIFFTIICISLAPLFFSAHIYSTVITGTLKISFSGFKNDKGKVMVGIYDNEEDYKKSGTRFREYMLDINENRAETIVRDLPYGTYAVKAYHDENGNNELDTGRFGIPKERYGFSNNASGKFGPAKWEEAKINFNQNEMEIHINLK